MSVEVMRSGAILPRGRLLTNDPLCPRCYFTIEGDVPHDLSVQPDRLCIVTRQDRPVSRRLEVVGPPDMEIVGASSQLGDLEADIEAQSELDDWGRKHWSVTVSTAEGIAPGERTEELRIRTTHAERPLITVPVAMRIDATLEAVPRSLFFGFVEPGARCRRHVALHSLTGRAFKVTRVQCDDPRVKVGRPRAREEKGTWRIPVTLCSPHTGVVDTRLRVSTDRVDGATIELDVWGDVVPKTPGGTGIKRRALPGVGASEAAPGGQKPVGPMKEG